jgi:cell division septation protein DedD
MARDHYHENSFVLKTITLARIVVGVALTLAVLFVMVRLIDYSSTASQTAHNRQGLLFQETDDEAQPRTLFEKLLNQQSEKSPDPAAQPENMLDRVPRSDGAASSGSLAAPAPSQRPAPAAPPPVSVHPASTAHQMFAVQLGAFQEAARAQALSGQLSGRGYRAYVDTRMQPDGTTLHRVRVGGFSTREEAMRIATRIEKAEKISGFVTLQ